MIGAKDLAFPRINLLSLIYILGRRRVYTLGADAGRYRHRVDFLHAIFDDVFKYLCDGGRAGIFINGFSSILTGLNFIVTTHTMRAPGDDLVPTAPICLGTLCDQPDHDSWDSGCGDYDLAAGYRTGRHR